MTSLRGWQTWSVLFWYRDRVGVRLTGTVGVYLTDLLLRLLERSQLEPLGSQLFGVRFWRVCDLSLSLSLSLCFSLPPPLLSPPARSLLIEEIRKLLAVLADPRVRASFGFESICRLFSLFFHFFPSSSSFFPPFNSSLYPHPPSVSVSLYVCLVSLNRDEKNEPSRLVCLHFVILELMSLFISFLAARVFHCQ